jgi:hypothetical protein
MLQTSSAERQALVRRSMQHSRASGGAARLHHSLWTGRIRRVSSRSSSARTGSRAAAGTKTEQQQLRMPAAVRVPAGSR